MAIVNGYATLSELKSYVSIGDTDDDTELEAAIESASRSIDAYCGRFFYSSVAATYTYTAGSTGKLHVDDVRTITTLKTDTAGDGTYSTSWAGTDFLLEPANAVNDGRPYTSITVRPTGANRFTSVLNGVQVVGDFGWATVPKPVHQACIRLANLFFKVAKEGAAPIITMDGSTIGMSSRYMDGHVQVLLNPYRRGGIAPGLVVA